MICMFFLIGVATALTGVIKLNNQAHAEKVRRANLKAKPATYSSPWAPTSDLARRVWDEEMRRGGRL